MSIFTFNPSPSPNIAFGPIAFRVPHASPHRLSHTSPRTRPRFPSPSPTLSPIVAHASPYLRSRFLLPSPTLPHTVTHAFPHLPSRFPSHRPRFLLPSPTLPPTVTHASPHRHPRFPPLSPKLPPTVAQASPHRRPRFPPLSPTLPPTVAHASPHRRPPPPSPTPTVGHACPPIALGSSFLSSTLGGEVWRAGLGAGEGVVTRSLWGVEGCVVSSTHPSLSCTDLLSSLAPTPHAWQVVVRLWSRVFGAQPGQRVQAGSKECSAAGVVLLSLSLPPFLHLSASLPSLPSLLPVIPSSLPPSLCLPTLFTLSVARPPFLPSFFPAILPLLILPRSSPPSPFHLPLSHSLPHANPAPPFHPFTFPLVPSRTFSSHPPIISSTHPLIRPSSHPPIISSAHHLIRPSSHPPIISSAHPLTVAHASALVPFRALSPLPTLHLAHPSALPPCFPCSFSAPVHSLFPTLHQSLWFVSVQVCHASSCDEYRV
ncbi:unnamed protein product [Closterium sp. NIES-64]|nr:unnamed protein product [Closterium sp. NIES-64]